MIIAALASAPGKAGISVIRLSGSEAIKSVKEYLSIEDKLHEIEYSKLYLTDFINEGEFIDQVTVAFFREGHSYTGEESAEIFCHGSPIIVRKILEALYLEKNIREAKPGEFTEKRFMNGKMDLVQAEAVIDLINSESDAAYISSTEQLKGGLSEELKKINAMLIELMSILELELDFADEDLDFTPSDEITGKINIAVEVINKFIDGYQKGRIFRDGIKVALVGEVNVGKSSLMNAFLKSDRVIVTDIAGTTRDVIEEKIEVNGYLLRIFDTAGIRDTEDIIENEGISRSRKIMEESDIVLHVIDSTDPSEDDYSGNVIKVYNKTDLEDVLIDENSVKISCKTGSGIEDLKHKIVKNVIDEELTYRPYYISNVRHLNILKETVSQLEQAKESIQQGQNNEVVIVDIRQALDTLGEITGETTSMDIINNIFGNFCIGK
ncbi:MAG: tRNA uridine-5-carboxymethylaminomethyl(34) synthesis GTPase MnmE [Candidatus Delongbacteria bacterium]|jgi:tRNA modification GTPase|nr:tRNA uridine-5-carboxymethylaminomethyl(34) synthesis GTPase MnmE [Candidatus Delongbacteria bacterium]